VFVPDPGNFRKEIGPNGCTVSIDDSRGKSLIEILCTLNLRIPGNGDLRHLSPFGQVTGHFTLPFSGAKPCARCGLCQRGLQDQATVAWNLATDLYYKTQPILPWKLAHVRPGVC